MKEFINQAADPIFTFPFVLVIFVLMIKYCKPVFKSRNIGILMALASLVAFVWAFQDPLFKAIVLWPDNVPIVILLILVGWTTWYALYKGINNDIRMEKGEPPIEGTPENREKVWCWPNLVYTELFCIILGTIALVAWAILLEAPLEEPANPTWAPNPAKAPWYFLGLQEMLVYFDPWMAGVVLPVLIIVGLIAIPYMDYNPKGNGYYTFKERKFAITSFLFGWLVLWIFLIIIGTFLRGPNWTFYGPFEVWDFHKVVAESNINLSEIIWIKFLNTSMPSNMYIREFVGIIVIILYFVIPIWFINKKWGKELLGQMGNIRYYLMIILFLGMASLPVKMFLRWTINLKYIVALPEIELNL